MNVTEAIFKRKSCRSFCADKELDKDIILKILNAGIQAPSGKNGQPWRFVVVEDKELIKEISRLSLYRRTICYASCLIFVYLDKEKSYDYAKDILAIGACIQNMLLSACDQNVAGCWIGEILEHAVKINLMLNIPCGREMMAMVLLGQENTTVTQYVNKTERIGLEDKIDFWY